MKKFKFKLETVLKVKVRIEEERKRQLQKAELVRNAAQTELQRRQDELTATLADYQRSLQQKFDRYLANDYYDYLQWLERQRQDAVMYLERCEGEVDTARRYLVEATRERKILDKLKEQAYQAYLAEELKAEIDFLDELGTGRFVRKESNDQGG
ncbi:MAG TPA: flagellar export protein FliJ [Bacillota bacterium]|nr:flagellar export protein FliJ [Bacillota bacterium]